MTEITKKEFDELYGDVEVVFTSYYKYSFVFKGTTDDGEHVVISVGGDADEIYRMDVNAGEEVKVKELYGSFAAVYPADAKEGASYEDAIHSYMEW